MENENNNSHNNRDKKESISIQIPKIHLPDLGPWVLMLLIVVGTLQTVQLFGLRQSVSNAQSAPATSTAVVPSSSTPSASGGASAASLPKMVGGC